MEENNSPKKSEPAPTKNVTPAVNNEKKLEREDSMGDKDGGGNRKVKKKPKFREVIEGEDVLYENIEKIPKKMSSEDISFIVKSLENHFFFSNLLSDEL